ncbi:MAG: hypothetical protein ACOZBL_03675, partial [Patescibacteria group bacterium]
MSQYLDAHDSIDKLFSRRLCVILLLAILGFLIFFILSIRAFFIKAKISWSFIRSYLFSMKYSNFLSIIFSSLSSKIH